MRSIGSRCSKARPTAELTMKRPTKNDSRPNAVRLRWKLSVRRSSSVSAFGSTRCKLVADDARQWRGLALRFADQKPRDLVRLVEQPLRHADIDDEHVGHELRQHAQRRQFCAAADRRVPRLPAPANRSAFPSPPASGPAARRSCSDRRRRGAVHCRHRPAASRARCRAAGPSVR